MKDIRVKMVHVWRWLVPVVALVVAFTAGSWYGIVEPVLQWFDLLIKYGI